MMSVETGLLVGMGIVVVGGSALAVFAIWLHHREQNKL